MRKIPANQLTQAMYGHSVTFPIAVRRGHLVHTMTLGHAHVESGWVLIRAKGAHPFDAYRVRAETIVQVKE